MGLGDKFKQMNQMKQALDVAKRVVADPQNANDLRIILEAAALEIESGRNNAAVSGSLREAFNTAASLLPVARNFINTGDLPMLSLLGNGLKYKAMADTFKAAIDAKDPVVMGMINSFEDNAALQGAAVRLAAKNSNLFHLQAEASGAGSLSIDMIPGQSVKVPLDKESYDRAKAIIEAGKGQPPKSQPPQGPGV